MHPLLCCRTASRSRMLQPSVQRRCCVYEISSRGRRAEIGAVTGSAAVQMYTAQDNTKFVYRDCAAVDDISRFSFNFVYRIYAS